VKKYLIAIMAIIFLFGCAADRGAQIIRTGQFGWTQLRDVGEGLYTTRDTLTFDLRHYRGAVTYWADFDTAGSALAATVPDSCLTIQLELYNEESGEWGKYYSGTTPTKLDTIDRAYCNVPASAADVYIPLAQFNSTAFAWADRGRIIEITGTGDKLGGSRWIGGQ